MSIQAHRCNQKGCHGFILFENADFDYKESLQTGKPLSECHCPACDKRFLVVVDHSLIEVDEDDNYVDSLPMIDIREWEIEKTFRGKYSLYRLMTQKLEDAEKALHYTARWHQSRVEETYSIHDTEIQTELEELTKRIVGLKDKLNEQ